MINCFFMREPVKDRGRLEHINEVISVITDDLPPLKAKIEQYLSEMK